MSSFSRFIDYNRLTYFKQVIWLVQQFSTWGTRTPWGSQAVHRGYAGNSKLMLKIKKASKTSTFRWIFWFGGTQRGTIMVWGNAEEVNFDLGVRKYLKVENPWTSWFTWLADCPSKFKLVINKAFKSLKAILKPSNKCVIDTKRR